MNSKEINEIIDKLEGLFDKMIQLKTLDNESRRLKLQEAKGGKQFPSGGWTEEIKTHDTLTVEKVITGRETGSMFEMMGQVFNPNANEKTFDEIQDQFKKDFRCQP